MRICDLCGKDLGDNGFRTAVGNTVADFCRKCYMRYQDKENELDKKYSKEMTEWIKKNRYKKAHLSSVYGEMKKEDDNNG